MKRLLTVMMIGLLSGIGLAGCGNDAGFGAIIVIATKDADFTSTPLDPGENLYTVGPILIKVQKSSSDTLPVPDVNVTLSSGGVLSEVLMCFQPWDDTTAKCSSPGSTGSFPDGGTDFIKANTDDVGVIIVYPRMTGVATGATFCPGTTGSIKGTASISALISSDFKSWKADLKITCP